MRRSVFADDQPAAKAINTWWAGLADRRAERAALVRQKDAFEVPSLEYHRAFQTYFAAIKNRGAGESTYPLSRYKMPAVLGMLAHIREPDPRRGFPEALAKGGNGKKGLSELRFRRLLQCQTLDELYPQLRRAIAVLGKKANVLDVAELIYQWDREDAGQRLRNELAYAYFEHAPKKSA